MDEWRYPVPKKILTNLILKCKIFKFYERREDPRNFYNLFLAGAA